MTARPLDPVLLRQLRRLKLEPEGAPPSAEQWAQLVDSVNEHYLHMNEDRALLNRSLELSTNEQEAMRRTVEAQRDRLSSIIGTIGDALAEFGTLAQAEATTNQIAAAKIEFSRRLQTLLAESHIGNEHTSDVSLIRSNLVRLADQLVMLLADTAERAALKKELEVARAVQSLLVPAQDVIERPRLQVVGYSQPAAETGGDWWTVADLPGDKVVAIVGDVTGHGVSAAIMTGAAKAACDLAIHVSRGLIEPRDLLAMMNVALFSTGRRQVMMTCVAAVHDPATGALVLANAGHPNPILVRQGVIHPLLVEGEPLGAAPDSAYQQVQLRVEPGDVLACFTDGIVEAENSRGEQFGERRLRAVSQRAAPGGARHVRDAIVEALAAFRGDIPPGDDLTFIATSFR